MGENDSLFDLITNGVLTGAALGSDPLGVAMGKITNIPTLGSQAVHNLKNEKSYAYRISAIVGASSMISANIASFGAMQFFSLVVNGYITLKLHDKEKVKETRNIEGILEGVQIKQNAEGKDIPQYFNAIIQTEAKEKIVPFYGPAVSQFLNQVLGKKVKFREQETGLFKKLVYQELEGSNTMIIRRIEKKDVKMLYKSYKKLPYRTITKADMMPGEFSVN